MEEFQPADNDLFDDHSSHTSNMLIPDEISSQSQTPNNLTSPDGETDPLLIPDGENMNKEEAHQKYLAAARASLEEEERQTVLHIRDQMVLAGMDVKHLDEQLASERNRELAELGESVEQLADTMIVLNQHVKQQGDEIDHIDTLIQDTSDQTEQSVVILDSVAKGGSRWRSVKIFCLGVVGVVGVGMAYAIGSAIQQSRPTLGASSSSSNTNDNNKPAGQ